MSKPLKFFARREEGGFVPIGSAARTLAQRYALGEVAAFQEIEEHDNDQRKAYFARIDELWANVPEHKLRQFPNADTLRYWALCREGFCTVKQVACANETEARRWADFFRRNVKGYLEVSIIDNALVLIRPKSQSLGSMTPALFKRSSEKVQRQIEIELGIKPEEFSRHMRGSPAQQSRT